MKRKRAAARRGLVIAGVGVAAAATAVAQTVHIDFDDRPAPSCAFTSAERIGTQWSASGVTFTAITPDRAGAIIAQTCTGFDRITGHSSPNLVGYVPGVTDTPVRMEFSPPVVAVSLWATNWNRVDTLTLTAYDVAAGVVDTASISTAGMVGPLQLLAVSGPGIVHAELTTTRGEIAFDDLEFSHGASGPIVYESADPERIVDPSNQVGPAGTSPFPHAPSGGPRLYYQVDDGRGSPALIRLVKDGGTGILIFF